MSKFHVSFISGSPSFVSSSPPLFYDFDPTTPSSPLYSISVETYDPPPTSSTDVDPTAVLGPLIPRRSHRLDVKNVFIHGDLSENVYMELPLDFPSSSKVYNLQRALYGLKQAPHVWFSKFSSTLFQFASFLVCTNLPYLFNEVLLAKYVSNMLCRIGLTDCKIASTPLDARYCLTSMDETLLQDPSHYRQLVRTLIYLIVSHFDIFYVVYLVSQFIYAPRTTQYSAVLRNRHDRRYTTSFYFFCDSLVSWCSKNQTVVSRSSTESEYRALDDTTS
ncbi:uncharacterized protein LOC127241624 [Andrographis paniculata]|uniref:uncharacterized protein LOC127241624 n=1 Tax=Andrographis paniculata TaxID=175694 RepID=UPI0021E6E9EB|nr:uncharacterized protein LOC127241624 [Andrographis paniculata]